jgi:4-phosphopantoate--beta-alanine ligase
MQQHLNDVPSDHPRAQSLHYRHLLVDGVEAKVVTPSGLCAHGRGEAFDYLIGEKTPDYVKNTIEATVAKLLTAKHPIISVNGNIAALIPEELVEFSNLTNIPLEINLFYRSPGRVEAIEAKLKKFNCKTLYGTSDAPQTQIKELTSNRRIVDPRGIAQADVVLVPLEDGDRTEALVAEGKFVIAIDLNPLSRTAQKAHITIVDNVIRCFPLMIEYAKKMLSDLSKDSAKKENIKAIADKFDQKKNLASALDCIIDYLKSEKSRLK